MDINPQNLRSIYVSLSTAYNVRFASTTALYKSVAMEVPSGGAKNEYPKLDELPGLREWIGDRQVNDLSAATYEIVNKPFEGTVGINRDKIEDDQIGLFTPIAAQLGQTAAEFPDLLTFGLLKKGDSTVCFDGQYFFDTDHPGFNEAGNVISVSNMQAGAGPAWYLVDDTNVMRAMVYQKRRPFVLTALDDLKNPETFFKNRFVWGVDGRCNVGFGMWQLAYMSKATLDAGNYAAARAAMSSLRKRDGSVISVRPRLLVVPPALEAQALALVKAANNAGGGTNVWVGTAEVLVVPHLA
ncbi:Mu-like prophage major head subunit gpT family protein [Kaistia dalseonensis]|uniref:Phage major head subunit gpT-like protein n=1 Tax=Kaistia dalseonensis TaxID=410840 RepID=A0ABU0HCC1_9HYPH|nr:Mu-like prophage major head subunit gpT family protein [Kaistia dalseonensis]MCX5497321.1 Mu-like prophage major head subunit gpT family protein [Kaistia dalseonensis]MDQ0439958.1 phage major head subunit gpT-like protein [Kaistia dalseonensis]